jgi:hypothetical protein
MVAKFTYTESEVSEIVAKYAAGETLDVLALQYNKSVPSVRMKLVKLGVYRAAKTSAPSAPGATEAKPKLTKREEDKANKLLFEDALYECGVAPF